MQRFGDFSVSGEIWAPIPGYEGVYDASSFGKVRSLSRTLEATSRAGRIYTRRLRGRILMPSERPDGYIYYMLWYRHRYRRAFGHVLVLEAFIGTRPQGCFGCHKDGIPSNNAVENLYWGTQKENMADAARHGTLRRGEKIPWSKLLENDVCIIRDLKGKVPQAELAARFGVGQSQISRIQNHREWRPA